MFYFNPTLAAITANYIALAIHCKCSQNFVNVLLMLKNNFAIELFPLRR